MRLFLASALVLSLLLPSFSSPVSAAGTSTSWDTTEDWDTGTKNLTVVGSYGVETVTDNPSLVPLSVGQDFGFSSPFDEERGDGFLGSHNAWGDRFSLNFTGAQNTRWSGPASPSLCGAGTAGYANITRGTVTSGGVSPYVTNDGALVMSPAPTNASVYYVSRTTGGGAGPNPTWIAKVYVSAGTIRTVNWTLAMSTLGNAPCAGMNWVSASMGGGWWLTHEGTNTPWTIWAWTKNRTETFRVCRSYSVGDLAGIPMTFRIVVNPFDTTYPWLFYWNENIFSGCYGPAMPQAWRTFDLKTGNLTTMMGIIEEQFAFPTNGFPSTDSSASSFLSGFYWTSPTVGTSNHRANNIVLDGLALGARSIDAEVYVNLSLLKSGVRIWNGSANPLWPFHVRNWTFDIPQTIQTGPYNIRLWFVTDVLFLTGPFVDRLFIDAPLIPGGVPVGGIYWPIYAAVIASFLAIPIAFAWMRRRNQA